MVQSFCIMLYSVYVCSKYYLLPLKDGLKQNWKAEKRWKMILDGKEDFSVENVQILRIRHIGNTEWKINGYDWK